MSISKVSLIGLNETSVLGRKSKWPTHFITLLTTVSILSALDLLFALIIGDSLSNYTKSVIVDLTLSVLGLRFCSDLIFDKDQDSITCFLAYMVFLWVCITILKLVFLL